MALWPADPSWVGARTDTSLSLLHVKPDTILHLFLAVGHILVQYATGLTSNINKYCYK